MLAVVLNLAILAFGIRAASEMSVQKLLRFNSAVISITTSYTGASADLVRGFITAPMERAIAAADGIDFIDSTSSQGNSQISAHLRLNADNNAAMTQITASVNQMRSSLPPEAQAPLIELQRSDNEFAIIYLGARSTTLNYAQLTDYLVRVVQPALQTVPGVQKSDIEGGAVFAVRAWLKPERLAGYGLTPQEVLSALARNNFLAAAGQIKGNSTLLNLVANTDLHDIEEFRRIPVSERMGARVQLSDVADVQLGNEEIHEAVFYDGKPGIFMGVWTLPDANSLTVGDAIHRKVDELKARVPAGVELTIPEDSTIFIRASLRGIATTMAETLLIVAAVIYLFMGSLRSVLVPLIAMPISLLGACGLMFLFGFSLNMLTILAIVLSVGLVVDDSIVVAENVERHIAEGLSATEAALRSARDLAAPIIAMTITLATVYTPIAFQHGLTGTLFREFALTLAGAVLVSGIVALTLSPIMSATLLQGGHSHGPLRLAIDAAFNRLRQGYGRILHRTLEARIEVLLITGFMILLIAPLYYYSASELAPTEDRGIITVSTESAPDASLEYNKTYARKVEAAGHEPEVYFDWQSVTPSFTITGFDLVPWGERRRNVKQIIPDLYARLKKIAGVDAFPTLGSPLPTSGNYDVELMIMSEDAPIDMAARMRELVDFAIKSGRFLYADTDLKVDLPQAGIVFDRDRLAAMGLDMQTVGNDLGAMLGGNYVNRFSMYGRSYKVIPQIAEQDRLSTDQLNSLYITGPGGQLLPLPSVARFEITMEPRSLVRFQQRAAAKLFGAAAPGYSHDEALTFLENAARRTLPAGYTFDYAGSSRQLRQEGNSLVTTLGFAVLLIYLALAAQFNSLRDPLIILLGSAPLAISGALMFTFLDFTTVNIYSQIGLITLVGLVSKNGILIVEFANKLQIQGLSRLEAVHRAAQTRLRPILITSAATVFGHLPLILATGAGAEARNSIGITLVTGMTIGTLFTLFVVPTLYRLVARDLKGSERRTADTAPLS